MPIYLHEPQDIKNLSVIARNLDFFGHSECYIYDSYHILEDEYGASSRKIINRYGRGSFFKINFIKVDNPQQFLQTYSHRKLATHLGEQTRSVYEMDFVPTDLILFGNEQRGLPADILQYCDVNIAIPKQGSTQSLNLAITTGIILYELNRTH